MEPHQNIPVNDDLYYLDSCCFPSHMTEPLPNMSKRKREKFTQTAGGHRIPITHSGSATLFSDQAVVHLPEAVVPVNLTKNLISVAQITRQYDVLFQKKRRPNPTQTIRTPS